MGTAVIVTGLLSNLHLHAGLSASIGPSSP
jgi:hypothetical protein